MGYATVKVLFDVSADELLEQFKRHAELYRPRKERAEDFEVLIHIGLHCSAIRSDDLACPKSFFDPIGPELAAIWMDVRYQDGDTWELSCYSSFEHELSHNVNPWPYDPDFVYDQDAERGIQYRIQKLKKLLPQFADDIGPYLLLWKYPSDPQKPRKLMQRTGKARPSDRFGYGDAFQYLDFLKCFGVDVDEPKHTVKVRL